MKKSRIFMAAGAIVLTVTAVFATKANKKFTGPNTAAFGASYYLLTNNASGGTASLLTATNNGKSLSLKLYTDNGAIHQIYGGVVKTISDSHPIFYNPGF